jgi:hypothetical protein
VRYWGFTVSPKRNAARWCGRLMLMPFGSAFPAPTLFPWAKLARYLGSGVRHMDPWSTVESLPPGNLDLRHQIARRYLRLGLSVGAEQIVVTSRRSRMRLAGILSGHSGPCRPRTIRRRHAVRAAQAQARLTLGAA